ncbi:MAG: hypothetical protein M1828_003541 [Chrysothrix sp. TS-e1954]|nr:MAG: hypothetical protein M1828_003541 [Chrysothrix sp. TS-e1954]
MAFLPRSNSQTPPALPNSRSGTPLASRGGKDPFGAPSASTLRISAPLEASRPTSPVPELPSTKIPPVPPMPPARPAAPVRSTSLAAGSGTGFSRSGSRKPSAVAVVAQRQSLASIPSTPITPLIYEIAQAEAVPIRRFQRLSRGQGDFCEVGEF